MQIVSQAMYDQLLKLMRDDSKYATPNYPSDRAEAIYAIESLDNVDKLTMSELCKVVRDRFGDMNSYIFLRKIRDDHLNNMDDETKKVMNANIAEMEEKITSYLKYPAAVLYFKIMNATTSNDIRLNNSGSGNQGGKTPKGYIGGQKMPQTSYSGTDMVCSITIPGKSPLVFGELSQLSYSIFREKVPVRSLGRVSMKGYTRGMRTITGIMAFTVFDQSIVYQAMKEIKDQGYRMVMDEMPLFDITISMANDFGQQSLLTLYGVSTYTEGQSMGVNDMMIQNVYEFYALDIDPISRMENPDQSTTQSSNSNYNSVSSMNNSIYWGH